MITRQIQMPGSNARRAFDTASPAYTPSESCGTRFQRELEGDLKTKFDEENKKQLEEEITRLKGLDELECDSEVLLSRKHIEEEIMQLRSPQQSCRWVFYALRCQGDLTLYF